MSERTIEPINPELQGGERVVERKLRPAVMSEYIGQRKAVDNLRVFIEAAKSRDGVLDHCLLSAPPGLGKTTLAHIIANELGVTVHPTSGPAIDRKGDLAGLLSNLQRGDVLFIDEIHRLNPVIEENLYPAMEDFSFDIVIGEGPHAKSIKLPLEPFTLIGATTRAGMLTSPLRDRFGILISLTYYAPEELVEILRRSASILDIAIDDDAALEVARRSRGTPRITNRLLRRVRDFAVVRGQDRITLDVARYGLGKLEIDNFGLDQTDQAVLRLMIEKFSGGPVGLNTLCAALSLEKDTLEDVVEPYLLQQGFIMRTPKGRVATPHAWLHMGYKPPAKVPSLFDFAESDDAEK